MADWKTTAAKRDLTVYRGEDIDIGGKLTLNGQPWVPPDGTTAYWEIVDPYSFAVLAVWTAVISGNAFNVHVEADDLSTLLEDIATAYTGPQIRFFIATSDTPDGNPKCVTTGKVKYV